MVVVCIIYKLSREEHQHHYNFFFSLLSFFFSLLFLASVTISPLDIYPVCLFLLLSFPDYLFHRSRILLFNLVCQGMPDLPAAKNDDDDNEEKQCCFYFSFFLGCSCGIIIVMKLLLKDTFLMLLLFSYFLPAFLSFSIKVRVEVRTYLCILI